MGTIELSVIISNFNTKHLLERTLRSLYLATSHLKAEIIVVDDCSYDGSVEMVRSQFPSVRLIRNKVNKGYSKSYNVGTKKSRGEFVLHLNSDVLFGPESKLKKIVDYLKHQKTVGIVGCRIIKPDGKLDLPCRRSFPTLSNMVFQTFGLSKIFPHNKLFGKYYLTYVPETKIAEIDCIMGAFMCIRRKVIDQIGLLDEQFHIYGEDIDYCLRAKNAGWKIVYFPEISIQHFHGGTTHHAKWRHIWLFHYAMYLYYRKHFSFHTFHLVNFAVYIGISLRLFASILIELVKMVIYS